jgi:parvulin-like peptidyl-prolyl isomerase
MLKGRSLSGRNTLIVGGLVLLVVLILWGALTEPSAKGSPSGDVVAVVNGQDVTKAEVDRSIAQAAKRQGLTETPTPDSPQYKSLRDQAMNDLLDLYWIEGEAADLGVAVSDREVSDRLDQVKQQQFKGDEAKYRKFLETSGYSEQDVRRRVALQLLAQKIQAKVNEDAGQASEADARKYYEANISSFEQPASRDIRVIFNKDRAKAEAALTALEADDSPANWDKVAAQYSTDPSKDSGGVRTGITEGTFPEPLNADIFDADTGTLQGPVSATGGFYVFQVDKATEKSAQPFDQVSQQIRQQLTAQIQQEAFASFLADYRDKWTQITVCADDYLVDRCRNFEVAPTACTEQQLASTGCPPVVISNSPAAPGSILPFVPSQGKPQRPHGPGEDKPAAPSFPGGGIPTG